MYPIYESRLNIHILFTFHTRDSQFFPRKKKDPKNVESYVEFNLRLISWKWESNSIQFIYQMGMEYEWWFHVFDLLRVDGLTLWHMFQSTSINVNKTFTDVKSGTSQKNKSI